MRARVRRTTLALAATAACAVATGAASCGRTGAGGGKSGGPTPTASLPVPQDYGDGHDGNVGSGNSVAPDCHVLTTGSDAKVTFAGGWAALKPGDRVLLLQVQDGVVLASGTAGGPTLPAAALGDAGRWEVVTVQSLAMSSFVVATPLLHRYSSAAPARRHAEACRIPQFANAVVDHSLQVHANPWDGNVGGVVALYVASTLQLSNPGAIDASAAGFRGGLKSDKDTSTIDYTGNDAQHGGGRGEGFDPGGFLPQTGGRGNWGSGGGGGNPRSAGGGGGGNAGIGGAGGMENENAGPDPETSGRGGQRVTLALGDRLLFGGGGGGGQQGVDGGQAGDGGDGGGAIVLFARHIVGLGSIAADGGPGGPGSADGQGNGAGGGGAGGTVVVKSSSGAIGAIYVLGGTGGFALENGERNGPGGGGAGGWIFVSGPTGPVDPSGGKAGTSLVGGFPTYGATSGGIGAAN